MADYRCPYGYGWCEVPYKDCPHWQGTFCELDVEAEKMDELKPCPFCGGEVSIILCDDEGNLHDEAYREHPYSGLGFMLHHAHEENPGCPIASYECDGGILGGVYIYDTEEQATEAWNRRADNDLALSNA